MSALVSIAEAVVSHLNATSFVEPFVAQRHYVPQFDLAEMATLHVSVVPKEVTITSLDRARDVYDYELDVAVQQKTDGSLVQLDHLQTLVEQIADSFRTLQLAGYPQARCIAVKHTAVCAAEHLSEMNQLTSIVTLTFRVAR